MPKTETLHIVDIIPSLAKGEAIVFAADKQTGQMSFEPLEDILINNRSITTQYFSARSLKRRVRGYYMPEHSECNKGEIDMVTPLRANAYEEI